ncbi:MULTISPECIES: hypothetical protein [unclassified Methanosarcina]|uniref:hypothetical protein n=1 Tax=unclassified Methanosarcina TaxID=2644672 RepID=UPI0009E33E30|nr:MULTISPECIES: hypothetical protein [unclassified Methanosarcina]
MESFFDELIPKLKNHLFELDFEIIIGAADQKIGSDTYEFGNKSWFWDRLDVITNDSMILNTFFDYAFICKKWGLELRIFGTTAFCHDDSLPRL